MATIEALNMGEIGKGITLKLQATGIRQFKLRFAIAMPLLKLFAWIAPVNVEIVTDEQVEITPSPYFDVRPS